MAVGTPLLENQNGQVSATYTSGTITVSSGDLLLIGLIGLGGGSGPGTAPTFDGTLSLSTGWTSAGSPISYGPNDPTTPKFLRAYWAIASGTSGTVTCNVQRDHYQAMLISIPAGTFNPSAPIAAYFSGTGITASIADRLSAGNMRVAFWAGTRNALEAPNAGWTELVEQDLFSNLRYCTYGATDTDPGLNNGSVEPFGWIVTEIAETAAATYAPPPFRHPMAHMLVR